MAGEISENMAVKSGEKTTQLGTGSETLYSAMTMKQFDKTIQKIETDALDVV